MTDYALRFDAGAPWLDLLATVGNAYGPTRLERLDTVARLTEWLDHERLTPATPPEPADLDEAQQLRETLRALARAALAGRPADQAAVATLDSFLAADRPLQLRTDHHGWPILAAPQTTREALSRIARQAVEHLTGPARTQLRACDDDACAMLYLDPTGRRRWCATNRCGLRARVRAHRSRHA